ncbi:hypothetical protein CRV24_000941 [Beauveria bassiana]|nr:hypothetical protein CRV24_000941 [Beauveria bassiana]
MRYHNLLAGVIAFTSAAAAQFIFPESSSNLQVNQAVQIRWNKANLQEPLSINLVPAGQVIRQDIVLQQVAVNIGNVGIFQWSADQTISAFPKFAMVIVDARSQVVESQTFAISGLTKQPNQQIDLNNGNAGGRRTIMATTSRMKSKNRVGGNQNDDKKQQNGNGQKDKATDKQQQNNNNNNNNKGSSTLLPLPGLPPKGAPPVPLKPLPGLPPKGASAVSLKPLPGLPPKGAPPVSLKPLPNTVESVPISKPAAAVPESSKSPAAPDAGKEASSSSSTSKPAPAVAEPAPAAAPEAKPEPAAAVPSPTAAASETAKEQPEPAQPAANGFTILQPSAVAAASPAKAVKAVAAAVPESTLKAEALAAGRSFREKTTSEVLFLTALGVQPGQDKTISTAITPRPVNLAASNAGGASGAQETSSPEDAKPTVLSEKSSAERKVPGLALGLLGVAAGVALL